MKKLLSFLAISTIALTMASCGGDDPVNRIVVNPNSVNGMMPGAFTVDASLGTKVHFSQGNLQYNAASGTWQFATNQWDVIGETNKNIAADYNGWIDLFGWNTADKPTLASDKTEDYPQSPFKDWGKNTIANGGNQTWKTLSTDEWNNIYSSPTGSKDYLNRAFFTNGIKTCNIV